MYTRTININVTNWNINIHYKYWHIVMCQYHYKWYNGRLYGLFSYRPYVPLPIRTTITVGDVFYCVQILNVCFNIFPFL